MCCDVCNAIELHWLCQYQWYVRTWNFNDSTSVFLVRPKYIEKRSEHKNHLNLSSSCLSLGMVITRRRKHYTFQHFHSSNHIHFHSSNHIHFHLSNHIHVHSSDHIHFHLSDHIHFHLSNHIHFHSYNYIVRVSGISVLWRFIWIWKQILILDWSYYWVVFIAKLYCTMIAQLHKAPVVLRANGAANC